MLEQATLMTPIPPKMKTVDELFLTWETEENFQKSGIYTNGFSLKTMYGASSDVHPEGKLSTATCRDTLLVMATLASHREVLMYANKYLPCLESVEAGMRRLEKILGFPENQRTQYRYVIKTVTNIPINCLIFKLSPEWVKNPARYSFITFVIKILHKFSEYKSLKKVFQNFTSDWYYPSGTVAGKHLTIRDKLMRVYDEKNLDILGSIPWQVDEAKNGGHFKYGFFVQYPLEPNKTKVLTVTETEVTNGDED